MLLALEEQHLVAQQGLLEGGEGGRGQFARQAQAPYFGTELAGQGLQFKGCCGRRCESGFQNGVAHRGFS